MTNFEHSDLQLLTSKVRADKAINSPKGLLLGIISDDIIDAKEMDELRLCAKENHNLINNPHGILADFQLLS